MKLLFLMTLWMSPSYASTLSLRYFVNNKYTNVNIVQVGDLKVNELCRNLSNCKAIAIAKGKPIQAKESTGSTFFNASSSYCWDVGAKARILKDAKNNEYDFCVFSDGSMIDAWNLYSKHYPVKSIN